MKHEPRALPWAGMNQTFGLMRRSANGQRRCNCKARKFEGLAGSRLASQGGISIAKNPIDLLRWHAMKRFLAFFLLISCLICRARAEGPDDQYVRIYNTIQEADALNNNGKSAPALAKYLEAQTALERFRRVNPEWNPQVLNFRLNYLAGKVASTSAAVPA